MIWGECLDLSNFDLYSIYSNFVEYFREYFKNYLNEQNILHSDYTKEDLEECLRYLSEDFLYESDYHGSFQYEKDKLFDLVKGGSIRGFMNSNIENLFNNICPCCKQDADFQGYVLHNMPMRYNGYCFEIEDMFDSGEIYEEGSKFQGVYCPKCGARFTYEGDIIEELSFSDVEELWKKVIDGVSNVFINEKARKEFFIEFLNYHKYNISNIINYVNKKHS